MVVAPDAGGSGAAIAGGDIEERRRRMWPGILDVFGKLHDAAFDQPGIVGIDLIEPQGRAEADIEEGLARHRLVTILSPRDLWRCERTGRKCKNCPTIWHGRLLRNCWTLVEAISQHSTAKIGRKLGQSVTSPRLMREHTRAFLR